MSDETKQEECAALVKYEGSPLSLRERVEAYRDEKRREVVAALRAGQIADPVTMAIFGVGALKFALGAAISIALSVASSVIMSALAPKPPPLERGAIIGEYAPRKREAN